MMDHTIGQTTNINLLGLLFFIIMALIILVVKREKVFIPIILTSCYITIGQQFVIFGLNFSILRLLIFVCWIRIILKKEYIYIKLNKIDKTILLWVISLTLVFTLKNGTAAAFINRMGHAYDALGLYFMFRSVIRDLDDVHRIAKIITFAVLPYSVLMLVEKSTGMNMFSVFGGVPMLTQIRNGELRCQGPFRHPILAGTFGTVNFVFILSLWYADKKFRPVILFGIIATIIIAVTSSSSGPFLGLGIGIIGLGCWYLRNKTYLIKRGIIIGLFGLDLFMKPPIWYIFAKLSQLTGGTGWYRSYLINQFLFYFREWVFLGTNYTAHWMGGYVMRSNPDMIDITNWYIGEGVNGGLITLILFIYIIVLSFRTVGIARRKNWNQPLKIRATIWICAVTLVVHVSLFLSTTYLDQIMVYWYILLAIISNFIQLYRINFKHDKKIRKLEVSDYLGPSMSTR